MSGIHKAELSAAFFPKECGHTNQTSKDPSCHEPFRDTSLADREEKGTGLGAEKQQLMHFYVLQDCALGRGERIVTCGSIAKYARGTPTA